MVECYSCKVLICSYMPQLRQRPNIARYKPGFRQFYMAVVPPQLSFKFVWMQIPKTSINKKHIF